MRHLYSFLLYLITPFIFLKLLWRARLAPSYRQRWGERFGFVPPRTGGKPAIWVHAVSVGETLAALPMIRRLQQDYPNYAIVVTTMTPTGSDRVIAALGDGVYHVYAPYDLPDAIGRFLGRVNPRLLIIMETELWPNIIAACHNRSIPVILANARLSSRSARGYQRVSLLAKPMLQQLTVVAAQHEEDASRFRRFDLAAQQVVVTGSIKFDIHIDQALRQRASTLRETWQSGSQRSVLVAASTHAGEDEKILEAFAGLLTCFADLLLVLVPRHPERFDTVYQLCRQNFSVVRRSSGEPVDGSVQILLGDTMGEVMTFFGAGDIAFIGGSWVDNGGHNVIEPAAWGMPIITGPSLYNFAESARLLQQAGGLRVVDNPAALIATVTEFLRAPGLANACGAAAFSVAEANRGALDRLLELINKEMD